MTLRTIVSLKEVIIFTWKVPGIHPRLLAVQAWVSLVLIIQSHTPSMHLEEGSAILHCKSVTQGSPKLTAPSPWSTRVLMPVVVGGAAEIEENFNSLTMKLAIWLSFGSSTTL